MRARHPDLIDWCRVNAPALKVVRKQRYAAEKGFVEYSRDISKFFAEYREGKKKRKEAAKADAPVVPLTPAEEELNRNVYQQAASLDLLRQMKWERVKWAPDADYESFARRITDNSSLFRKIPAFSFLKLDLVKDESSFAVSKPHDFGTISSGDISSWACGERIPSSMDLFRSPAVAKPPCAVDWVTGQVTFLDSISANEIQTFMTTLAPQAMALQVRLDDEQKKIAADLEALRLRTGIIRFQYNNGDNISFWQDPRRVTDPLYVNPAHMRMFLDGLLRGASFYRYYLSGHEVRIVHPNSSFSIDSENKVISIPANFSDSNWVTLHSKAASFEKVANACRRVWYIWFCLAVMLVGGDLDIY